MNISGSRARFIAVMSVNGEVADDGGEEATSAKSRSELRTLNRTKLDRNHPLLGQRTNCFACWANKIIQAEER